MALDGVLPVGLRERAHVRRDLRGRGAGGGLLAEPGNRTAERAGGAGWRVPLAPVGIDLGQGVAIPGTAEVGPPRPRPAHIDVGERRPDADRDVVAAGVQRHLGDLQPGQALNGDVGGLAAAVPGPGRLLAALLVQGLVAGPRAVARRDAYRVTDVVADGLQASHQRG